MPLKRFSHLYTFAPSAASRPYWNRLTCFGIVQENSYNGPAIVDNVYFMTCKRWKRFDLPCLICVKNKLVEVDSSIQRRCLDGVCFLLRSAFPAGSYARVLALPRTGRGRPRRDDGANDPRGARTLIEPERLMKPSLKRGSKKYAGAGARGEHKRTVSATRGSWRWARSVRSLSFCRRSITIISIIRKRRRQEARSEEKRFDPRRRRWSSPFRRARGTRRLKFSVDTSRSNRKGKGRASTAWD